MNTSRPFQSIAAYIAEEARTGEPKRALDMLKALVDRLEAQGMTLEQVIDDALTPHRHLARMPSAPMGQKNWRDWVKYLYAQRASMPEKDARHLKVCFTQRHWLSKMQMRWIYDILARTEPSGCGTWGAPE